MEHDHPNALNFLRADCEHSLDFFRSSGVCCSIQQLFDFVVDPSLTSAEVRVSHSYRVRASCRPEPDERRGAGGCALTRTLTPTRTLTLILTLILTLS